MESHLWLFDTAEKPVYVPWFPGGWSISPFSNGELCSPFFTRCTHSLHCFLFVICEEKRTFFSEMTIAVKITVLNNNKQVTKSLCDESRTMPMFLCKIQLSQRRKNRREMDRELEIECKHKNYFCQEVQLACRTYKRDCSLSMECSSCSPKKELPSSAWVVLAPRQRMNILQ